MPKTSKTFSRPEVASHNKPDDLWLIISSDVYNVTEFQHIHPGGQKVLRAMAGKDATKQFRKNHNEAILKRSQYKDLCIGSIHEEGEEKEKSISKFSRVLHWKWGWSKPPSPLVPPIQRLHAGSSIEKHH